ncbi:MULTISPECIES: hypothetical protein [Deefgea]|uniref:DUF3077 domain-containing protein n=1 Tax=Deefgea salmonis TaxID=2875502 RepID=A0ABS8BJ04_9NEIS|nr:MULTISPECIES: hypothetical protein [Deefgea]MCB5195516.1 hypothetical protein [Deefgea salmonis]QZA81972.1 hypothetical protein K4H25_04800 [Deefgea piscis]
MTTTNILGGGAAQTQNHAALIENLMKQPFDLATLVPVSADLEAATVRVMSCGELLSLVLELLNEGIAKQQLETHCQLATHYLSLVVQASKAVAATGERNHA